ncbi:MAG: hypothetical protein R2848_00375 [Thermomicrobiales bacterium]
MDHPAVSLHFTGAPELTERLDAWVEAGGLLREEGTTVLASSDRCPEAFDLHLYPVATRIAPGEWAFISSLGHGFALRRRHCHLLDRDPRHIPPVIDHVYFGDPRGTTSTRWSTGS